MNSTESNFPAHLFIYDALTGIVSRNGKRVGSSNGEGYLTVQREGIRVCCHRLAWKLETGSWPTGEIDHINHDRSDNRIENLREVSSAQNKLNRLVQSNNRSGIKGVLFDTTLNRWKISLTDTTSKRKSWYASTRMSASLAAPILRRVLHGEFSTH